MLGLLGSLLSGPLGTAINKGVDGYFDNKEDAAKMEAQIKAAILENKSQIEAQAGEVVMAEIKQGGISSWWRPILMLVFTTVVAFHYLLFPLINMFMGTAYHLDLPQEIWTTLNIGIGGYVVGRSGEKIAQQVLKK